jgi:Ran GTPase-activating protein (RanGAP) involved in mRNA processing and transport
MLHIEKTTDEKIIANSVINANLSLTSFTLESAKDFADSLKKNSSILTLSLRSCPLTPDIFSVIVEAITQRQTTLELLDLDYNHFNREHVSTFKTLIQSKKATNIFIFGSWELTNDKESMDELKALATPCKVNFTGDHPYNRNQLSTSLSDNTLLNQKINEESKEPPAYTETEQAAKLVK